MKKKYTYEIIKKRQIVRNECLFYSHLKSLHKLLFLIYYMSNDITFNIIPCQIICYKKLLFLIIRNRFQKNETNFQIDYQFLWQLSANIRVTSNYSRSSRKFQLSHNWHIFEHSCFKVLNYLWLETHQTIILNILQNFF